LWAASFSVCHVPVVPFRRSFLALLAALALAPSSRARAVGDPALIDGIAAQVDGPDRPHVRGAARSVRAPGGGDAPRGRAGRGDRDAARGRPRAV
jgi:hypothetical protein